MSRTNGFIFNPKNKFIYFLRQCNFETKIKIYRKTEKEGCKSENSVYVTDGNQTFEFFSIFIYLLRCMTVFIIIVIHSY